MRSFRKFLSRPAADRRLLLSAAALHLFVAGGIRLLPFRWVRRVLDRVATPGPRAAAADAHARVVQAVRTVAFVLPGANCLTEALAAQCLLARAGCESTLRFGLSGVRRTSIVRSTRTLARHRARRRDRRRAVA